MSEIKNINIEINLGQTTIKIPIKIIPFNFRNVTKTSNCGLNVEYIIRNDKLNIIGRGSKEQLAIENFKKEYQLKMR